MSGWRSRSGAVDRLQADSLARGSAACRRRCPRGRAPVFSNVRGRRIGSPTRSVDVPFHTTRAGLESTQVERVADRTASCSSGYAVSSTWNPTVEPEPVDEVGADSAADTVGRLQRPRHRGQHDARTLAAARPGQPGPHDHHFGRSRKRPAVRRPVGGHGHGRLLADFSRTRHRRGSRSVSDRSAAGRRIELRPSSIASARTAAVASFGDRTQAAPIRSRSAALENWSVENGRTTCRTPAASASCTLLLPP